MGGVVIIVRTVFQNFISGNLVFYPVERLFSGQVDDTRRTSLSPDTMTLIVLMYEALPLVRKIRADRIVDDVRNFN